MIDLRTLAREIREISETRGWWDGLDKDRQSFLTTKLALISVDAMKAREAIDAMANMRWLEWLAPDGYYIALADIVIRILDVMARLGLVVVTPPCYHEALPFEYRRESGIYPPRELSTQLLLGCARAVAAFNSVDPELLELNRQLMKMLGMIFLSVSFEEQQTNLAGCIEDKLAKFRAPSSEHASQVSEDHKLTVPSYPPAAPECEKIPYPTWKNSKR